MYWASLQKPGGPTSHSAIIARSYEIPAVLGISGIISNLSNQQEIILDAVDGEVLIAFDEDTRIIYEARGLEAGGGGNTPNCILTGNLLHRMAYA